ncbi:MAG: 50S ribosomal protein L25 [Bacteroidales bacterium]|nr:50S ribosomal protein L25 [Bacteroidales bacterium]
MDKKTLKADIRTITGRKVKTVRKQGLLPANIYGKKIKSESVQVNKKEFEELYKEVGETGLVSLQIEKDEHPVLVSNVQLHPVTNEPIHVDFREVDLKTKVTASVPVEVVGESPAEKQGIGTVVQYINEVEVEALPADLVEKFEVDTSLLSEVDQAIFVKDLKVDASKVEIKTNPDEIVAKVEPPQKEEVVEAPVVEGEPSAEAGQAGESQQTESSAGQESTEPKE